MGIHNPSPGWDDKERRMVDAELGEGEEKEGAPEKEKVNVVTEEEEESPLWSGLFCCYCHDLATFIYQGNSICHTCYHKEIGELIKKNK